MNNRSEQNHTHLNGGEPTNSPETHPEDVMMAANALTALRNQPDPPQATNPQTHSQELTDLVVRRTIRMTIRQERYPVTPPPLRCPAPRSPTSRPCGRFHTPDAVKYHVFEKHPEWIDAFYPLPPDGFVDTNGSHPADSTGSDHSVNGVNGVNGASRTNTTNGTNGPGRNQSI